MLDPRSGAVQGVLAAIDVAVGEAASVPRLAMTSHELLGFSAGLQSARAQLDSLVCAVTADADRAAAQTLTGHRSIAASVGSVTNADTAQIAADRRLGRWLDGFAIFRDAFAAGTVTRRHVEELRKIDNPRTHQSLVEAQGYLVEAAVSCGWKRFKRALRYWLLAADPDGEEPKAQREKRKGSILTLADGTVKQINYFDPVTGAAVKNAVETRAKQLWRADAEREKVDPEFLVRSHGQRTVDASAELQIAGHHAGAPTGTPPLIHIVMSERAASDALTRLADPDGVAAREYDDVDPARLPLDVDDVDGRCELVDGTPIHPSRAIALLSRATLRRLVMGADSEVLDLGRSVRGFPRRLRDVLMAQGRGSCAVAGCDAPSSWLEADHILAWAKGGPTSLRNGQMLCGPHNRAKGDREAGERDESPDPPQLE